MESGRELRDFCRPFVLPGHPPKMGLSWKQFLQAAEHAQFRSVFPTGFIDDESRIKSLWYSKIYKPEAFYLKTSY